MARFDPPDISESEMLKNLILFQRELEVCAGLRREGYDTYDGVPILRLERMYKVAIARVERTLHERQEEYNREHTRSTQKKQEDPADYRVAMGCISALLSISLLVVGCLFILSLAQ